MPSLVCYICLMCILHHATPQRADDTWAGAGGYGRLEERDGERAR